MEHLVFAIECTSPREFHVSNLRDLTKVEGRYLMPL
jgi:hypothetical protein